MVDKTVENKPLANKRLFDGRITRPERHYSELPQINFERQSDPQGYISSDDLAAAVNVALTLGMPLLLTGEPGCGKSELARRIAWELQFPAYHKATGEKVEKDSDFNEVDIDRLIKFSVKSSTEAKDLFYLYDNVGRYHASHEKDNKKTKEDFISYQALGLALLRAKGKAGLQPQGVLSPEAYALLPEQGHRSVVLIDEIDKAPRDVPNDILTDIEHMETSIPELEGRRLGLDGENKHLRPVVIITSNSERDLPEAFLRRCVYFHLAFPPFAAETGNHSAQGVTVEEMGVTVEDIVTSRLGQRYSQWPVLLQEALSFCRFLRQETNRLEKKPGLAEIINWLTWLADELDNMQDSATNMQDSATNMQDTAPNMQSAAPQANSEAADQTRLQELGEKSWLWSMQNTLLKTVDDQGRGPALYRQWREASRA